MNRQQFRLCIRILGSALFALLMSGTSALAQGLLVDHLPGSQATDDGAGSGDAAWRRGVTPEQREQAQAMFQEATRYANEYLFEEAVARYQEALAVWNHPAIHANMSMVFIAWGRPLKAYRATQEALRHGPEPLGDDEESRQRNVKNLRKLAAIAREQLIQVDVTSTEHDVEVLLENERIETGDDSGSVMLLPGRHQLSAQKTRHETLVRSLDLNTGRNAHLELFSVHRVTPWKPWAVFATGVGLTLAGTGLVWHAHGRQRSLGDQVASACEAPLGCRKGAEKYDSDWASIRWEERLGTGSLILGLGAALAGGALIWWNQERQFHMRAVVDDRVSITPVVSPAMTGVSGAMWF